MRVVFVDLIIFIYILLFLQPCVDIVRTELAQTGSHPSKRFSSSHILLHFPWLMLMHICISAPDFSPLSHHRWRGGLKLQPMALKPHQNFLSFRERGMKEPWEQKLTLDDLQSYRKSNKQIVAVGPVGWESGFKTVTET